MIAALPQRLVPGIVGISTFVDFAYHKEMQQTAVDAANTAGPINRLRALAATLDFALLLAHLQAGRPDEAEEQVARACESLAAGGADFIAVTSGTTSTLTGRARKRVSIPFLDLAEACWQAARPAAPVGLLCTRYAAAGGLFQSAADRHGAALILPAPETAERVDQAIFGELVHGVVSASSLAVLGAAIEELARRGAASIILGNTDMTLAAERLQEIAPLALVDSARAHARWIARAALSPRAPMFEFMAERHP